MEKDYISYLRSKVGHDKVFLNFAAGILADENRKILLQRRSDKGTWGLVGGAMELGESSVNTLKREFLEESGLVIEPLRLLNIYTNFEDSYPNGDIAQTVGMVYEVAACEDKDISRFHNEETLELGYFSKEEIVNLDIVNEQHQLIIDEYFSGQFSMGN